jgi:hypothetical protein
MAVVQSSKRQNEYYHVHATSLQTRKRVLPNLSPPSFITFTSLSLSPALNMQAQ